MYLCIEQMLYLNVHDYVCMPFVAGFLLVILFTNHCEKQYLPRSIGPILVDRLKEKFLIPETGNPERVSSVFTFVSACLCVCLCPGYRGHLLTQEPFWVKWSLEHEKKNAFICFSKFSFLRFLLAFFDFFLL